MGGRPSNIEFHDPGLEPVIEIHSKHGTFEWFLEESIRRGYRVGFTAGSDDHYGHPGAVYPGPHIGHFASGNGLTALYTEELTREGIWEALKARRCYATNGARILLRFQVNGHWMGEEIESDAPPRIEVEAAGTGPIERIEVFRGMERIHAHEVSGRTEEMRLRILFAGARVRGRGRATCWAEWEADARIIQGPRRPRRAAANRGQPGLHHDARRREAGHVATLILFGRTNGVCIVGPTQPGST